MSLCLRRVLNDLTIGRSLSHKLPPLLSVVMDHTLVTSITIGAVYPIAVTRLKTESTVARR